MFPLKNVPFALVIVNELSLSSQQVKDVAHLGEEVVRTLTNTLETTTVNRSALCVLQTNLWLHSKADSRQKGFHATQIQAVTPLFAQIACFC